MRKSELQDGQVVKLNTGEYYYKFGNVLINNENHILLSFYNSFLRAKNRYESEFDINIVYPLRDNTFEFLYHLQSVKDGDVQPIWKRAK